MELFDCKMIILKWINSCDKAEQVELLEPFISEIIVPKYEKELEDKGGEDKKVLKYDLEATKIELAEAIQNRKLILAGTPLSHEYPLSEKDISSHPENKMNELT